MLPFGRPNRGVNPHRFWNRLGVSRRGSSLQGCPREAQMTLRIRILAIVGVWLMTAAMPCAALAQKHGGVLQAYTVDSPASMSIHEEFTVFAERPMQGVFNNLITFDPKVRQNSINSI